MSTGNAAKVGTEHFGTVCVAMVTPFGPQGELDLVAARKLAAHLVDLGCDSLVVSGTTGESPTTSVQEKLELLQAVKDEVGDRAKIIAGTGTNNTASSIELTRACTQAGADAILLVTPYYSKPSQRGVIEHCTAVARATDLPITLYDIPGRTGIALSSETILELAKVDNIVAMKDAKGNLAASAPLIAASGLAWYSGDDPLNLPFLSVGASGFISVIGHLAADRLRAMYEAFDAGDLVKAREINATLTPLVAAQGRLGGASFVKAALRLQGLEVGDTRLPVGMPTEEEVEVLRRDLEIAGVL